MAKITCERVVNDTLFFSLCLFQVLYLKISLLVLYYILKKKKSLDVHAVPKIRDSMHKYYNTIISMKASFKKTIQCHGYCATHSSASFYFFKPWVFNRDFRSYQAGILVLLTICPALGLQNIWQLFHPRKVLILIPLFFRMQEQNSWRADN